MKLINLFLAFCLLVGALALSPVLPAQASTLTVNMLTDENDNSCVDGDCSLRDAVKMAVSGDTIDFSVTGSITLNLGQIYIGKNLTISSPGYASLVIDANHASRIFDVGSNTVVNISGLTLTNGRVTNYEGGAILNRGTLTLDDMLFENNEALGTGPTSYIKGGAIYNGNNLTVTDSSFINNTAWYEGGAIYSYFSTTLSLTNVTLDGNNAAGNAYPGGGSLFISSDLSSQSTATLTNVTVTDNSSTYYGGGIMIQNYADVTIQGSTLSGNTAGGNYGGGIYVSTNSSLTISNTTIQSNSALKGGGGLVAHSPTLLEISNSTISGNTIVNSATSGNNGAGIYVSNGSTLIRNSTISSNSGAYQGGGLYLSNGTASLNNVTIAGNTANYAGGVRVQDTLTIKNSIIADNTSLLDGNEDCASSGGTLSSKGYNLLEVTTGGCSFTAISDITGQDPVLSPLANYGGATQTMALGAASPALDSGNDETCETTDQRGVTRPQGSHCDIGAYEVNGLPNPWSGGVSISGDQNVIAVGRPEIGAQKMTYNGFGGGSTTAYVPMLFKDAFGGSYDAALYIQNLHSSNTANITIKYYDTNGNLTHTVNDTIARLSSKGYWLPAIPQLGTSWVGAAVITSDQNIVAVGRPHIGSEILTYNGFAGGSTTVYVPMLFKDAFGGSYDAALYVQNLHPSSDAHITIQYYDTAGNLTHTATDTLARLSSKGYWLPGISQLGSAWVGAAVITSDTDIVAVGRPHIGSQIMTYDGFASGLTNAYVPMLFKDSNGGSYDSALYIQNVHPTDTANISLKFYDTSGNLTCTVNDTITKLSSKGYWLPAQGCLGSSWQGSVKVESDLGVVAVGRPHLGSEIMTYDGAASGSLLSYLPMLFRDAFGGSYDSTLYFLNTDPTNSANLTLTFYDTNGNLSCSKTTTIPARGTINYFLPALTCEP